MDVNTKTENQISLALTFDKQVYEWREDPWTEDEVKLLIKMLYYRIYIGYKGKAGPASVNNSENLVDSMYCRFQCNKKDS